MKLGAVIEESKDLEMNLSLITDFTGSFPMMLSTTSYGRWFFLCRRICGSLVFWDILETLRKENQKIGQNGEPNTKQRLLLDCVA